MQNNENIPIIYHIYKQVLNQAIIFNTNDWYNNPTTSSRFLTSIPSRDRKCKRKNNAKKILGCLTKKSIIHNLEVLVNENAT